MDEIDRARERERGGRDGDGLVRMACFVSVSLGETVDPRCWSYASRLRARRAAAHGRGANAPGPSVKSGHGHRAGSPLITYIWGCMPVTQNKSMKVVGVAHRHTATAPS